MGKSSFKITWQEWLFVLLVGIFGFLAYIKQLLVFLNTLNPAWNFIIYYGIWFVIILALSLTGFVVLGKKINNPVQIIGTLLILFSVGVILGWSNNYVTYATTGSFSNSMNIYFGCEDGIAWWIFYDLIGIHTIWLAKLLAFSILPMLTALLGVFLVTKVKFNMWGD
jgi:hypothetical protein